MNPSDLPDFINSWGIITIIVSCVCGVAGWPIHWWMTTCWHGGKHAAALRLFLPALVAGVVLPALVSYGIVEYYSSMSDALSQYNGLRAPDLDLAGKMLFLIYDISGNEAILGKIFLCGINAIIGVTSYLLVNALHGIFDYAGKKLQGGH